MKNINLLKPSRKKKTSNFSFFIQDFYLMFNILIFYKRHAIMRYPMPDSWLHVR
jgi:hypothetical protein